MVRQQGNAFIEYAGVVVLVGSLVEYVSVSTRAASTINTSDGSLAQQQYTAPPVSYLSKRSTPVFAILYPRITHAIRMANQTLLNTIQSEVVPRSWESACIAALNSSSFNWSKGLVDAHGHAVDRLTNSTWGITFEACQGFCNHNLIPFVCDRPGNASW